MVNPECVETNTLIVALQDRSYKIEIGIGNLKDLGTACTLLGLGKKMAIITNPTVGGFYLSEVSSSLRTAGFDVYSIEVPDGEKYKNIDTLASIYDGLVSSGMDRGGCIVALGGGVIGDMAGFAAASFLRGIPFIQVPTTLLAQVDSSVGGKTGINLAHGKNLVGAFYQPALVMIDVATLSTLAEREFLGGLAEIVKYGVVLDRELFLFLEEHVEPILRRDQSVLTKLISRCCSIKADVVARDERESDIRAVLNYGHTLGHAVETLTGYQQYTHGEAVAIGMVAAASFSELCGFASQDDTVRIRNLIQRLDLPSVLPVFTAAEYMSALFRDKKVRDGGITFVCNRGIGDFSFTKVVDLHPLLTSCGIGE
ncbi:MAG: 3-dehydroquinate synthase [Geobacter sp.]|nr:3-dehydroquinate synthase [Geobacter sp.]